MIFPYKNFIFLNIIISFVIAEIYNKIIPKYDKISDLYKNFQTYLIMFLKKFLKTLLSL